jgi:hypothetical protein
MEKIVGHAKSNPSWSDGVLGLNHHSITPPLHYSRIPTPYRFTAISMA